MSLPGGFGGGLQASQGAGQRRAGAVDVGIGGGMMEAFLGALPGRLRPPHVNLRGFLRRFHQHPGVVGQHFQKSPADRDVLGFPTVPVTQIAGLQFGEQRRVARQHSHVAVADGQLRFFGIGANHQPLGGRNFQAKRICHFDEASGFRLQEVALFLKPDTRYAAAAFSRSAFS
jgi:hypothetical protein